MAKGLITFFNTPSLQDQHYLMLKEAAPAIAVILDEVVAAQTLTSADVICTIIVSAVDLLRNPLRLTATLRSESYIS